MLIQIMVTPRVAMAMNRRSVKMMLKSRTKMRQPTRRMSVLLNKEVEDHGDGAEHAEDVRRS